MAADLDEKEESHGEVCHENASSAGAEDGRDETNGAAFLGDSMPAVALNDDANLERNATEDKDGAESRSIFAVNESDGGEMQQSDSVTEFMGARTALGTANADKNACRLFTKFCMDLLKSTTKPDLSKFSKYIAKRENASGREFELNIAFILRLCFLDDPPATSLPDTAAVRLRFFLIEFEYFCRGADGKKLPLQP